MIEKDPSTYSWLTYTWVLLLSAWGGAVSFFNRVKNGDSRPTNFMEFIGELITSAFTGVITFYLCEAAHIPPLWTAVMVGICGHMGTRALYQLEKIVQRKLGIGGER